MSLTQVACGARMARAIWCGDDIYDAADLFRERCLRRNASLFSDDGRVWTVDALRTVDERVARPDLGSGTWIDKLVAQLEDLTAEEIQLGAELLYVLLLPQSDTHAPTKRDHLGRILGLLPNQLSTPERLDAAFDVGGVANFSTAKSWSPVLLRFVARLAIDLKELPEAELEVALADPWKFREVVDRVRTSTDQMMANAMKHLLFPETFEYMISPSQREQLVGAFAKAPGVADLPDHDQRIARIRQLASAGVDGDLNLYDETFKRTWSEPADPRWVEAVRFAEKLYARDDFDQAERTYKLELGDRLADARNAFRAGDDAWPRALEKAFKDSRNNLIGWRTRDAFLDWAGANVGAAETALGALWTSDAPKSATLHDFIEALPVDAARGKGTRASVMSFLLMAVDASRFPFFRPTVHDAFRRALGLKRLSPLEIDPEVAYRPEDLAARLGLDGRRVRHFLRETYTRAEEERGQDWYLAPEQAETVLAHFGDETDVTAADALYADWMSLLAELRLRLLAAGTPIRDVLDAQGLAWWLVQGPIPRDWSGDEAAAFEAFRAGAVAPPPGKPMMKATGGLLPEIDQELAARLHLPLSWLAGLTAMLEEKKQLILFGPPGTGKTFVAQHLGRHIEARGGGYRLVQFHPSYTYEDFFEGYRPRLQQGGTLSFELVHGALREIADEAEANPAAPYLLIIDEINRGNIAKIFGELYFLLEYRDQAIRLQYSRHEQFKLPENVYVLGTMNTADRSIALVDSALRRRFYFLGLMPTAPPVDGSSTTGWLPMTSIRNLQRCSVGSTPRSTTRTSRSARPTSLRKTGHCLISSESGRTQSCRSSKSGTTVRVRISRGSSLMRYAGASPTRPTRPPAKPMARVRAMATVLDLEAWSQEAAELPANIAALLTHSGLVDVRADEPPSRWRLITDSRVGVVTGAGYDVRVRPRLAIPKLMFLLGYAADPRGWRELGPRFDEENELFGAIAHGFAVHAERALSPAPVRGYVTLDDQALTLRGRVRVGDQIARWPGLPIPLEVTYDDHVVDVPENQLVRGAAELLLRLPQLAGGVRLRLLRVRATLEEVEPARASPSIRAPEITRLNERYAGALKLAELILRSTSISTSRREVTSVAFVFDMNRVFEDFLSASLRLALERHRGHVQAQYGRLHLDAERRLRLKPDITWWTGGACRAVVDAKYKALADSRFPNADAYQMLAYCTAFGLDRGYLVYAKDAGQEPRDHTVRGTDTRIHVRAIDVEKEPADVLQEVDALAAAIAFWAE